MILLRRLFAQIKRSFRIVQKSDPDSVNFNKLDEILQYPTRNRQLISEALTHRSYLQVLDDATAISNERLEFLGDAVLNLVVAEFLFHQNRSASEGELTKIRARLVNRKALGIYARELNLSDYILMSPSTANVSAKGMDTILADAYEALLGAIYLDGGYGKAKRLAERNISAALKHGFVKTEDENFKSQLLEYAQGKGLGVPRYNIIQEEGPDHDRIFTIEVCIAGTPHGIGKGTNKKDAEQAAAEQALLSLDLR